MWYYLLGWWRPRAQARATRGNLNFLNDIKEKALQLLPVGHAAIFAMVNESAIAISAGLHVISSRPVVRTNSNFLVVEILQLRFRFRLAWTIAKIMVVRPTGHKIAMFFLEIA
jgi:hypothetical protein